MLPRATKLAQDTAVGQALWAWAGAETKGAARRAAKEMPASACFGMNVIVAKIGLHADLTPFGGDFALSGKTDMARRDCEALRGADLQPVGANRFVLIG